MKNLLNSLKTLDYKQFFLDHGEKIGFGVAVVLVLGALGMANRETYDKSPDEFKTRTEQAESDLRNSKWPDKDRTETFALVNFANEEPKRLAKLSEEPFHYIVEMSPKLYPRDAQLKDISPPPAETLIADAARILIYTYPEETAAAAETQPADEQTPEKSKPRPAPDDDEFATPAGTKTDTTTTDPTSTTTAGTPTPTGVIGDSAVGSPMGRGYDGKGTPSYGATPMGEEMEGSFATTASRSGRGLRFIAVRGIVPHKKLMEIYKQSLHTISAEAASTYIVYEGFVVQRQQKKAGSDEWTEWKTVDLDPIIEAMEKEWEYWDQEIVNINVTDPALTQALPPRAMGTWKVLGTHPRLKDYELTLEQMEEEQKKNEEAAQKLREKNEGPKGSGFKKVSLDLGRQRRAEAGSSAGNMPAGNMPASAIPVGSPMGNPMGMNPREMMQGTSAGDSAKMAQLTYGASGRQGMSGESGQSLAEANTSEMILFRFFDTDIEPGQTYRYRMQYSVANPNLNAEEARVEKPEVAKGEIRESEWSEPTAPVTVENDVKHFLVKVPRRGGKPQPMAQMELFQWDTALGTIERGAEMLIAFGQHVGGVKKTERLDILKETLEERVDVNLFGQDLLVDAAPGPNPILSEHTDLNLPKDTLATIDKGLLDEAVTVDANGNLQLDRSHDNADELNAAADYHARQMKAFDHLRESKKEKDEEKGGGSLDEVAEQYLGTGTAKDSKNKSKKKKTNPGRASSAPGMMPAGMPGMSAPGMSSPPGSTKSKKSGGR